MNWLDRVGRTIAAEFSDLAQVEEITRIAVRLLVAACLGALLGLERESKGKAAGVRTHILVAVGSALFVLIPQQAGIADNDLTRVMQGVIAGIGFLGAGAILKRDDAETRGPEQRDVRGLTTAASIWMTAAIGMAAGFGRESTAIFSTLLALATLTLAPYLIDKVTMRRTSKRDDRRGD